MTPRTVHPQQQFHVGEHVVLTHDGKCVGGVVVGIVPAGGSAWLMARMLGYSGSGIRRNRVRVEVGYLVKTVDGDGRERVRFPFTESLSRSETGKVCACSHCAKHRDWNTVEAQGKQRGGGE